MSILLSFILAFSVFSIFPPAAFAASSTRYIYRYWDASEQVLKAETRYANADLLQDMDAGLDDLYNGWYYSSGYKEFDDRVTVHGEVNIILTDSSFVKFTDGICVNSGNTLNIYGQDRDDQYLEAVAESWDAAIGSDDESGSCGNINIYGAGIGGGDEGDGGSVTIYGGKVEATGGSLAAASAADIGSAQVISSSTAVISMPKAMKTPQVP